MRSCNTSDDLLFAFVDGLEESLDDHVATCDECQAFLAELWQGELTEDLTEPVMQRIRLAEFVADVARFGLDIASAMGRGLMTYGPGAVAADDSDPTAEAAGAETQDSAAAESDATDTE